MQQKKIVTKLEGLKQQVAIADVKWFKNANSRSKGASSRIKEEACYNSRVCSKKRENSRIEKCHVP